MLILVGHFAPFLLAPLDRDGLPEQKNYRKRYVGVFSVDVGFDVVLKVAEIPPMGPRGLQPATGDREGQTAQNNKGAIRPSQKFSSPKEYSILLFVQKDSKIIRAAYNMGELNNECSVMLGQCNVRAVYNNTVMNI